MTIVFCSGKLRLEVGNRYTNTLCDGQGVVHRDVPFLVVKEATIDEWIDEHKEDLGPSDIMLAKGENFYHLSLD